MDKRSLITGFPRIGADRELKKALEGFWEGKIPLEELRQQGRELRKRHWLFQKEQGVDLISCNDFSYYDQMLDTAVMLGIVPERFRAIEDPDRRYFAMARGAEGIPALEMTKWFGTNYHYLVPELDEGVHFQLNPEKILTEFNEAKALGLNPKVNLIGPVTFCRLCKTADGKNSGDYFPSVLEIYRRLIEQLGGLAKEVLVQIEEPLFVQGPSAADLDLLKESANLLATAASSVKILVMTYFEQAVEAASVLVDTPVWGIGLDFVCGPENRSVLQKIADSDKQLVAGVVDGRNVWAFSAQEKLEELEAISRIVPRERITVSTSNSLLHLPYSIQAEPESPLRNKMAFACEKVQETVLLARKFNGEYLSAAEETLWKENVLAEFVDRKEKGAQFFFDSRDGDFQERIALQRAGLKLPELPTTTIGSFPQTKELRKTRLDYRRGRITEEEYDIAIKCYIEDCVRFQEEAGLDVLVHGEPERTDMVEYFGQQLDGFHFTQKGWVQSYGSRCVKPPIIHGDVSRPNPMTVKWIRFAQSLSPRPMKGMLTGPVTIINWSFVRQDVSVEEVARQLAEVLSREIDDLQKAGIKIIQVDEAAFKEGYPLREEKVAGYEKWAVGSFRHSVSSAWKKTQIHTHMCYSDFTRIIGTIEAMDADVITIETARSGNRLLRVFRENGYANEVGPGVYDIHSPRIPSVQKFDDQIQLRLKAVDREKMWINPDCGLKTRKWEEVKPALTNMVQATLRLRN